MENYLMLKFDCQFRLVRYSGSEKTREIEDCIVSYLDAHFTDWDNVNFDKTFTDVLNSFDFKWEFVTVPVITV